MSSERDSYQQDLFSPIDDASSEGSSGGEPAPETPPTAKARMGTPKPWPAGDRNLRTTYPDDRYLTDREVAKRYGVSRATIWRWRNNDPHFPQPIVVSPGTTRWALSCLLEWEARMPTAPRGYVRGSK